MSRDLKRIRSDALVSVCRLRTQSLLGVNVLSHRSVLIVGHQLRKVTRTHTGYPMFDAQISRHTRLFRKARQSG